MVEIRSSVERLRPQLINELMDPVDDGQDAVPRWMGETGLAAPAVIVDAAKAALDRGESCYVPPNGIAPLRDLLVENKDPRAGVSAIQSKSLARARAEQDIRCIEPRIAATDSALYYDWG